ncbi:MAG: class I SAM-dependent methyltransferase [Actinomycetota bacterium]|nr:class I SAM-dependent methyltransferase [Actinomycetota bacterium]
MSKQIRATYVNGVRGARTAAARTGVLDRAERSDSRFARWSRSLFAIWDIDEMVELDLAWWTFDAMTAVDRFLATRPDATVVEYGSGASTLWLAKRAARVVSVEHDREWATIVAAKLAERPDLEVDHRVVPPVETAGPTAFGSSKPGWQGYDFEDYVRGADDIDGPIDLAVVDGRCRAKCFTQVLDRIAPDGLVLFDNTRRRRYADAITATGLPTIETTGLTACLPYPDKTTLVFHDDEARDRVERLLDGGHPGN